MGSDFVSFEEAANRLCRTKRMVQNYVRQGFLRKKVQKDSVLLYLEDVEQLAIELGADLPAMNRKNFFHLMNRVRKLEEDIAVFKRMWDIQDRPLRPSETEAIGLFRAASQALQHKEWELEEVDTWSGLFDRMDEVFLDAVSKAVTQARPWTVFYTLCLNMMAYVSEVNRKQPSLSLPAKHAKLDEGRKKLRATILMWTEMGRGSIPEGLFRVVNTDQEDLLRRLAAP